MQYRFWDRSKDWVLLGVCLVASLAVLLTRNEPVVRGLRASALGLTSGVEARFAWAGRYLRALDENERLRETNVALASEASRAREAVSENDRYRKLLAFRDTLQAPMRAVRIVSKGLTVDAGSADGLREGMAVLDDRGIMGRVVLTSRRYARVMPYLNTDFRVTARILPIGAEGIVRWSGARNDRLSMEFVARTEPVRRGQAVVTAGRGDVFPEGCLIGYVESVNARAGRNALDVELRPAAPLARATHAFVLLALPDSERVRLEAAPLQ